MSDDGDDRVRGLPVFTCPEPANLGCRLTKRACAQRHLLRMLYGKKKTAIPPAHLRVCAGCALGRSHAKELAMEEQEPVRASAVRVPLRRKPPQR